MIKNTTATAPFITGTEHPALEGRFVVKGHAGTVVKVAKGHYLGECKCGEWAAQYEGKDAINIVWAYHQQHKHAVLAAAGLEATPVNVTKAPQEPVTEEEKAKWLTTFLAYAEDAGNWSGNPWVSMSNLGTATPAMRSHLRTAEKKGLLTVQGDPKDGKYIVFTAEGVALAKDHGIDLGSWYPAAAA